MNQLSRLSFRLYHFLTSKKAQILQLFTKSQLNSKIHHRCVNNPFNSFKKIKIVNSVRRVHETKMSDFKVKDIYSLSVLVLQIGFLVVIQLTVQKFFILLHRQPINTKNNISGHLKDYFSQYNYQTSEYDFMTLRTKKLQIFVFFG